MDPKIFPEPEKFNPLRFIAKDGKLINVDRVIPFGIGNCRQHFLQMFMQDRDDINYSLTSHMSNFD